NGKFIKFGEYTNSGHLNITGDVIYSNGSTQTPLDTIQRNDKTSSKMDSVQFWSYSFVMSVLMSTTEDQFIPNFQAMEKQDGSNAIDEETKAWVLGSVMATTPQRRPTGVFTPYTRNSQSRRGLHTLRENQVSSNHIHGFSSNWFRTSNIAEVGKIKSNLESISIDQINTNAEELNERDSTGIKNKGQMGSQTSDFKTSRNFKENGYGYDHMDLLHPLKDLDAIDQFRISDYLNL
ncbi:hypothetical protein HK096_000276, partial [Nowakowskiella sp. JEL0078]